MSREGDIAIFCTDFVISVLYDGRPKASLSTSNPPRSQRSPLTLPVIRDFPPCDLPVCTLKVTQVRKLRHQASPIVVAAAARETRSPIAMLSIAFPDRQPAGRPHVDGDIDKRDLFSAHRTPPAYCATEESGRTKRPFECPAEAFPSAALDFIMPARTTALPSPAKPQATGRAPTAHRP